MEGRSTYEVFSFLWEGKLSLAEFNQKLRGVRDEHVRQPPPRPVAKPLVVDEGAIAVVKYSDQPEPWRIIIGPPDHSDFDADPRLLACNCARVRPLLQAEPGDTLEVVLPNGAKITATINDVALPTVN